MDASADRMGKLVRFIEVYDIEFQLRFDFSDHGGRGRELSPDDTRGPVATSTGSAGRAGATPSVKLAFDLDH
jgi:hypothetical protein